MIKDILDKQQTEIWEVTAKFLVSFGKYDIQMVMK